MDEDEEETTCSQPVEGGVKAFQSLMSAKKKVQELLGDGSAGIILQVVTFFLPSRVVRPFFFLRDPFCFFGRIWIR